MANDALLPLVEQVETALRDNPAAAAEILLALDESQRAQVLASFIVASNDSHAEQVSEESATRAENQELRERASAQGDRDVGQTHSRSSQYADDDEPPGRWQRRRMLIVSGVVMGIALLGLAGGTLAFFFLALRDDGTASDAVFTASDAMYIELDDCGSATLSSADDEVDTHRFAVEVLSEVTIWTEGQLDTMLTLYDADNRNRKQIGFDDDSGERLNARATYVLAHGDYEVDIALHWLSSDGQYTICIASNPW